MDLHSIELFAGVGMLGEGLRAGLGHLGLTNRVLCYVEREAYAAAVLAARIEEGALDRAAVWSDVCTFDARAWHGRVDCIVAGFPCQDLSVAGRRAGLDGKRSGLFFEVVRIATDSGAWVMFLENVAGIASATASVVDAEEGELDERAASRVLGELADLGWDAEWITLAASDVGASHGRARWFCLAWLANAGGHRQQRGAQRDLGAVEREQRSPQRYDAERCDSDVGDAGHGAPRHGTPGEVGSASHQGRRRLFEPADASRVLAHTDGGRPARLCWPGQARTAERIGAMANTSDQRLQVAVERGGGYEGPDGDPHAGAESVAGRDALPLFAPGPADPRWPGLLAERPELAPALEPGFRCVVDGLAFDMGDSRAARLRCIGNGVVPLQAGLAFVVLARRSGVLNYADRGTLRVAA